MRSLFTCPMLWTVALGCGGDDLLLPADAAATRIAIAAGDGQQGAVGSALAESIAVLVSDPTGRPVMGQPVAFGVTAGEGASLTPDTVMTGADGRAGARWILGRKVGTQQAKADLVVPGADAPSRVMFSASASPGSAERLTRVSGDDQSAPAGSLLPDSLVVRADDQFGNPVAGVSVSWAVSGGGSVSPSRVTTAANGRAAVRRILGSQAGAQGATASASGLTGSPVAFTHSATATGGGGGRGDDDPDDQVVRLSFLVQPSDAGENERITPAVKVAAINAAGSPVSGAGGEVEIRLGRGDDEARLRGDPRRALEGGVATFSDLKVDHADGMFTLIASAPGVPDVESAPFRIRD